MMCSYISCSTKVVPEGERPPDESCSGGTTTNPGDGYARNQEKFDLKAWDFFLPGALICEEDEVTLVMDMLEEYNAMQFYGITQAQLRSFILDIKEGMAPKDTDVATRHYHTWTHVIDVTHCVYFFLTRCELDKQFSNEDCIALLTAALGHDYGHVGVTNGYLINTHHELAIKYHNQAVQENMHADATCAMLAKHNFLDSMGAEVAEKFREKVKGAILSTDMGGHGVLHKKIHAMQPGDIPNLSFDDKVSLLGYVLHSADLSNPAKPMKISKHWENNVVHEFFGQGNLEKSRGMTVSPNCEVTRLNRPDLQFKFLQFVILPSYKTLAQLFPTTELCLNTALENQKRWALERDNFLNLEQQAVLRTLCADTKRSTKGGSLSVEKIEGLSEKGVKRTTRWLAATKALDSDWWVGISTVLTIFALFGDDFRLMLFDISADNGFVVISAIIFIIFFLELALTTYANIGFALSFFFWLDLIAWLSMVTDVTPLWDSIQGAFQGSDGNTADFSVAKNARAARTIRIIRLIRLVRIIKLIKSVQKKRELAKLKEMAKAQKMNLTFSAKDRDIIFKRYNGEETKMVDAEGTKIYRENTTKNVHFPSKELLKAKVYKPLKREHVQKLANDAFNNYEVPTEAGSQLMKKLHMNELDEIEFRDWEDTIRRAQGEQVQLSLWEHKLNQPSQVGQELSDVTIRRVIILVLALLFVFPQLTALDSPAKEAQTYGLEVVHRYSLLHDSALGSIDATLLEIETEHYLLETAPLLLRIWPYDKHSYTDIQRKKTEEDIRKTELIRILCTGCDWKQVQCDPTKFNITSSCVSEAWYDDDGFSALEATYNIVKTCCVIAALMIGAYFFIKDAEELVIKPIERMTNLVQELAKNPLAKISFEELKEEQGEDELPYEIQLLEDTLSKISKLVQMGFGNVGAEIVSKNLANGEFDPVQPGKRMYGIYGTCNIRRFTDTTDCLQEDVTVFINDLGGMIHHAVSALGGLVSQNLGDSFLLIWQLKANSNDILIIEAMLQPDHLKSEELVVDYFQAAVAEDMAKHRAEQAEKEWEPSVADNALIAFAFCVQELQTSSTLKAYRDNKKLMRKFEYPFIPNLGFGLHAGWAIQGAIGSKLKIDASFMSKDVEISTYMRTASESFDVPIMMSHVFYHLLTSPMQKQSRILDCVKFGDDNTSIRPLSVYTFDVMCSGQQVLFHQDGKMPFAFVENLQYNVPKDFIQTYNAGVQHYLQGNWSDCAGHIQKAIAMVPGDGPATKLLEMIKSHEGQTPQDWPGFRQLH